MDKQTVIANNLIIRTTETEPGKFVTIAVRKDSDTLVDSKMATNEQDALKDYDDMITTHALPLQARVHAARMVKGKRYTLLAINDFGFPGALCFTFDHLGFTTYAQYDDAVTLYFTPKGKRNMRYMYLYNRPFAIYEGWRTLPDTMIYNISPRDENGITVKESRYCSFDERYMQEILREWPDYIACYQGNAKPVDTKPAEQKQAEPARPQEIMRGITCVQDADHGMCVDMTPEIFASVYGNPEGQTMEDRLIAALRRAAVASTEHLQDEDGGTCNLDSPVLDYKASGVDYETAKSAIERAGLVWGNWQGCLVIIGCLSGQGNRRTKMAEAFSKSLEASGFASGMYYQMD